MQHPCWVCRPLTRRPSALARPCTRRASYICSMPARQTTRSTQCAGSPRRRLHAAPNGLRALAVHLVQSRSTPRATDAFWAGAKLLVLDSQRRTHVSSRDTATPIDARASSGSAGRRLRRCIWYIRTTAKIRRPSRAARSAGTDICSALCGVRSRLENGICFSFPLYVVFGPRAANYVSVRCLSTSASGRNADALSCARADVNAGRISSHGESCGSYADLRSSRFCVKLVLLAFSEIEIYRASRSESVCETFVAQRGRCPHRQCLAGRHLALPCSESIHLDDVCYQVSCLCTWAEQLRDVHRV
jgi:hypothetical protein